MSAGRKNEDLDFRFRNGDKKTSSDNKTNKIIEIETVQLFQNYQHLFLHSAHHPKDMPRKRIQETHLETRRPILGDLLDTTHLTVD